MQFLCDSASNLQPEHAKRLSMSNNKQKAAYHHEQRNLTVLQLSPLIENIRSWTGYQ